MLYKRRSFTVPATNKANPEMCKKGHSVLGGACLNCRKTVDELASIEESQLSRATTEQLAAVDASALQAAYEARSARDAAVYVELFGGPFDGMIVSSADVIPFGRTNTVTIDGVIAQYDATADVVKGIRHFVYDGTHGPVVEEVAL